MTTHGSVAKRVRLHKALHPNLYCPDCLWRTGGGYCPRHDTPLVAFERIEEIASYGMSSARTASGRRPAQKAFRARLGFSLVTPGPLAVPWLHEPVKVKQPDDEKWEVLA
jgi:hypothetical protein